MFTIFLSKAFVENIFDKKNYDSELFDLFLRDFFAKLNISTLVCDFNLLNYENESLKKILLKSFIKDGVPFRIMQPFNESLEDILLFNSEKTNELNVSEFRKLFFINLSTESVKTHSHIRSISFVSSIDFERSFSSFLINGQLQNETTLSSYFNHKEEFNPFYCPGCDIVLVDDSYFLIKKPERIVRGKIIEKEYIQQLEEFIDTFLEPDKAENKSIVFMVPLYEYDNRKLSWSNEEQEAIRQFTEKTVHDKIPSSKSRIFFHKLKTHSRKVLTNRHFYVMESGFDFIRKYRKDSEGMEQIVDGIEFRSVYVKNNVFNEYMKLRIGRLNAKGVKYFRESTGD